LTPPAALRTSDLATEMHSHVRQLPLESHCLKHGQIVDVDRIRGANA